jgi:hypothetical protein
MMCGARGSGYFRKSASTTRVQGLVRFASRGAIGVDLDGRQRTVQFLQRTGECAVACADFDDGTAGAIDSLHNGVDDTAIVKKVLAMLMPARMRV